MSYRVKISTSQQADRLHDHIVEWLEAHPLLVTVDEFKRPKTYSQNNKWEAMVRELADFTGDDFERTRDHLKKAFGPHEASIIGDSEEMVPKSVSKYTRQEMSDMIERTYQIAAEIGCVLQ